MTFEEQTLEDAIIEGLHESVFNPERAARLIRRNLDQGIACKYVVDFYKTEAGMIVMETNLHTKVEPKKLGRRVVV